MQSDSSWERAKRLAVKHKGGGWKIYKTVRAAHVESTHSTADTLVIYRHTSYDVPRARADVDIVRLTLRETLRLIALAKPRSVEINEPAMIAAWPRNLVLIAALAVLRRLNREVPAVTFYALENHDMGSALGERFRLPQRMAERIYKTITKLIFSRSSRVVFGTRAAQEHYGKYIALSSVGAEQRLIWHLPAVCMCVLNEEGLQKDVDFLFLGSFEARKGILEVMRAWDEYGIVHPGARLRIVGKGPLAREVEQWVTQRDSASLLIDPPRDEIHRELRSAKVLILPSRTEKFWREQVGLPITEALSHGCLVVTSRDTGLASWLERHGHYVISNPESRDELSGVMAEAAANTRTPQSVMADLPERDGRAMADEWLRGNEK